jgi:hypothetical protein
MMVAWQTKSLLPLSAAIVLAGLFFAAGCEGPQGPRGEGIDDIDMTPPQVVITRPAPGDTVYTDTLNLAAVASDEDTVRRVEFLISGEEALGALLTQVVGGYRYGTVWGGTGAAAIPAGSHILQARAIDEAGNHGYSPPLLFERQALPAEMWLLYYEDPALSQALREDVMYIPDPFGDRYWNVRFSPLASCRVLQVEFGFRDPAGEGLAGPCDIRIHFWEMGEDFLPGNALADSFEVGGDTLDFEAGSTVFDVEDLDLEFATDFHVGYSPLAENYSQYLENNLGIAIAATVDDQAVLANGAQHRSIEYDGIEDPNEEQEEGRWVTMYTNYDEQRDLHIRALVQYDTGTMAWIRPVGATWGNTRAVDR